MSDLTFTTSNSFLHHGIEGQKWGVRNGPPYPLSRGDRFDGNWVGSPTRKTELARKWINVSKDKNKNWVPTAYLYKDQKPSESDKGYSDSKLKSVNPELPQARKKYRNTYSEKAYGLYSELVNNCTKCSAVMALKIMGYKGDDMRAGRAAYGGGYENNIYKKWFNNVKEYTTSYYPEDFDNFDKEQSTKDLEKLYSNFDNMKAGSFGMLSLKSWYGGHAINYYINDNKEIMFIDSQVGNTMKASNGKEAYQVLNRYMGNCLISPESKIYDLTESSPNFVSMAEGSVIGGSGKQSYAKANAGLKRTVISTPEGPYELVDADLSKGIDTKHIKKVYSTYKLKVETERG